MSFEFFGQEFCYIHCIWLQSVDIPFTTKVCPSFECIVADITACASGEIDVVNDTGSTLIGPTFEDLDRMDFSLWLQKV